MTGPDLLFVETVCRLGKIHSPVLELGAGYGGDTSRGVVLSSGREYYATDIAAGPGVDFVADFEADSLPQELLCKSPFGSALVLNVLEHVFEPLKVLDNALRLVRIGGSVVTITPSMWPIHNHPRDCYRLLPDWYVTYAARRACRIEDDLFVFIGSGRVGAYAAVSGERHLPPPTQDRIHLLYSRLVHRIFNTAGRGMWTAGHSAIGAVFTKTA